jgi:hypothetical protein
LMMPTPTRRVSGQVPLRLTRRRLAKAAPVAAGTVAGAVWTTRARRIPWRPKTLESVASGKGGESGKGDKSGKGGRLAKITKTAKAMPRWLPRLESLQRAAEAVARAARLQRPTTRSHGGMEGVTKKRDTDVKRGRDAMRSPGNAVPINRRGKYSSKRSVTPA